MSLHHGTNLGSRGADGLQNKLDLSDFELIMFFRKARPQSEGRRRTDLLVSGPVAAQERSTTLRKHHLSGRAVRRPGRLGKILWCPTSSREGSSFRGRRVDATSVHRLQLQRPAIDLIIMGELQRARWHLHRLNSLLDFRQRV